MLSGYGSTRDTPSASFRWWYGLILLMFFLLFVGALGGGWWWWSNRSSSVQSQQQSNDNPAQSVTNPLTSSSPTSAQQSNTGQMTSVSSADDDLERLQEKRSNAKPSESRETIAAFEEAERKYPSDYRFTFERARLFGKGMISHDDAFDALFLAAEKAIDGGKNPEMLDSMTANKDGDFYRLSRGHREWLVIAQALSDKDKATLQEHTH